MVTLLHRRMAAANEEAGMLLRDIFQNLERDLVAFVNHCVKQDTL